MAMFNSYVSLPEGKAPAAIVAMPLPSKRCQVSPAPAGDRFASVPPAPEASRR